MAETKKDKAFKRLYSEFQEGRVSINQAVSDVLAVLAGEDVERHATEEGAEKTEEKTS